MGHQSMTPNGSRKSKLGHQSLLSKRGPKPKGALAGFDSRRAGRRPSTCFISTACAEACGLPDDCRELEVLRVFRCGYVAQLPEGPEVLAEYAKKAPRIVEAIDALEPERAREHYEWIYGRVAQAVLYIEAGLWSEAYELYAETCFVLEERFLGAPTPEGRDTEREA
jgi:hypothetical protein